MILLAAILAGMAGGWLLARWQHGHWTLPPLHGAWLVILAFLPQFFAFYLPATRTRIPGSWVSAGLLGSQIILLVFCWLNLRLSGTWLMTAGLALNFLVIAANGGLMPISPQTAGHLAPQEVVQKIPLGSRLGTSKDVLLDPAQTHLEWLADRYVLPDGIPYRTAFSLGDIVIAAGAFWLITTQGQPLRIIGTNLKETECYQPRRTNPPSL